VLKEQKTGSGVLITEEVDGGDERSGNITLWYLWKPLL
jgi:hypothetical protein